MKRFGMTGERKTQDQADLDALARLADRCERLFQLPSAHAPGAVFVGAEISARAFGLDGHDPDLFSLAGKGLTRDAAFRSCMGEGAERLSSLVWGDEPAVEIPFDEGLAKFSARESDWVLRHLNPGQRHGRTLSRWLPALRLGNGEEFHLPETLCLKPPDDGRVKPEIAATSNGCAAAPSLKQAILAGLLELIERDAAALWWYGGRRPGALDPKNSARAATFVEGLRGGTRNERPMRFLDLTTDLTIPVVAAVSSAPDGSGVACGLAARLDLASAVESATLEACQMELAQSLVLLKRDQSGEAGLNDGDRRILRRMNELNACTHPLFTPDREGDGRHAVGEGVAREEPAVCEERLTRRGFSAYWVDLTREEIAVPAARVVVPGLQALAPAAITPRLAKAMEAANLTTADIVSMVPLL